jgi:hypothetical protein
MFLTDKLAFSLDCCCDQFCRNYWNLEQRRPCPFLGVNKITFASNYKAVALPWIVLGKVKVKVKCTRVQALKLCTGRAAHRGSRGLALPFHGHGTRRGWGVSVTLRPLFTPRKTRYPLYRRLGGPQGCSGQVRNILPPPRFDPRTVQPVASCYTDCATRPTMNHVTMTEETVEFCNCWFRLCLRH